MSPPVRRLLGAVGLAWAASAAPVQVKVLPNGADWRTEPRVLSADGWPALRAQVEASGMEGLGEAWWLADPDGLRVSSWEQVLALPPERRAFNIVPGGRPYQWGPRRVGERFPVKMGDREGVELETVAAKPGVFLIHNLFTEKEALYLIDRATKRTGEWALSGSGIGFKTRGPRLQQNIRTSASAFDSDSPGAMDLIKRAFEVLRMNFSMPMADGLQILRYEIGQAYIAHTDWFHPGASQHGHNFDTTTPGGSNRYATVFLYLFPPPTGGYTVFPKASIEEDATSSKFVSVGNDLILMEDQVRAAQEHYKDSGSDWEVELTRQCYSKLAVKPVRLGAALFYHQHPMTGRLLEEAEHGACPSMTGTKWGANLWIWNTDRHLTPTGGDQPQEKEKAARITLQNAHTVPLQLEYSMDDGALWKPYSTLGPGESTTSMTYGGTTWRFVMDGKPVRVWNVPSGLEQATFASVAQEEL